MLRKVINLKDGLKLTCGASARWVVAYWRVASYVTWTRHCRAVRKHVCGKEFGAAVAKGKAQPQLVERNGHGQNERGRG